MPQPRRRRPGRRWWWLGLVIAVVVLLLGLVAMVQRSLIYFPDRSAPPPAAQVLPEGRDVTLQTDDGVELSAWLVPGAEGASGDTSDPAAGTAVLYLPGNGGNRAGRAPTAALLAERGFTVLLVDYRGYGGNPGRPTEAGLAADALAAHDFLVEEGFAPDRQIYLGESLGTGVAAALAAERPPAGLLLRSPFTELADVGRAHYPWLPVGLLLRDRFPVLEHVRGLKIPVTVVRGTADDVVPTSLSETVARAVPNLVEEVVLDGVGHNGPEMFGPELVDAVARLAEG